MARAVPSLLTAVGGLLLLAATATAKTDLGGCTSTKLSLPTPGVIWYDPETGEICEILDCGGGRAPPKTTVPGCPLYKGTETVTPSFWAGFTASVGATASASATTETDKGKETGTGTGTGTVKATTSTKAAAESGTTTSASEAVETAKSQGTGKGTETSSASGPVNTTAGAPESSGSSSASPAKGGDNGAVTLTMEVTSVATAAGGATTVASSGSGGAASPALQTGAATAPTAVGKGVLGLVAGVAAAGLVLA
ncbi:uncharacterized protein B0T15DRAFT_265593 [Chaetomium strumarium]|uniref:Siderophore biosynthesis n=1 Tax=Chaetomium strumarium TaxID=1170767 RepID=A0AAJ0GNG5_9PEZI|nr:hypothetical protein B0T15DRAFT_265593 [Chaetomium strumarium]